MHNPILVSADRSLASLASPDAITASTHAVNAALAEVLAAVRPPDGLPAMREAMSAANSAYPPGRLLRATAESRSF